jgi:hypothetical protein
MKCLVLVMTLIALTSLTCAQDSRATGNSHLTPEQIDEAHGKYIDRLHSVGLVDIDLIKQMRTLVLSTTFLRNHFPGQRAFENGIACPPNSNCCGDPSGDNYCICASYLACKYTEGTLCRCEIPQLD